MSRFNVERRPDLFDDVGADGLEILPSGAAWFTDEQGELAIAYAPGTWLTITVGEE